MQVWNVWNHSLTNQNTSDLERVQKSACKLILKNKYQSYEKSLDILNLDTLKDRRDSLCLAFAKSSDKNNTIKFEVSNKHHNMTTRNTPKYKVTHCNTDRLLKSAIPCLFGNHSFLISEHSAEYKIYKEGGTQQSKKRIQI